MALSCKTSTTIANVASKLLLETVDVEKVEAAIAAVHEAGDVAGDAIKELVDWDTKVSKQRSTA